jgi:RNA polymerase sigma-70 factor, ECF subfamily
LSSVVWDGGSAARALPAEGADRAREELFTAMYTTYAPRVRALAAARLRGRCLADDVVQETFLRVHRNLDRFDTSMPPWPWLKMIATNVCTDVLRSRQSWAEQTGDEISELVDLAGGEVPADAFLAKERRQGIATVLAAMNPRQRRALVLTGVEGWKAEEVADLEGSTVTAVRATLKRGRQSFRTAYLTLADERGLLGVGGIVGSVRLALRRARSMATSAGGQVAAVAGPVQLATAAVFSVVLVGGMVVAAGPWSWSIGGADRIARTGSDAGGAVPAIEDAVVDAGTTTSVAGSSPSAAGESSGPTTIAATEVTVPDGGGVASVAATTAIEDGEESSLIASVGVSVEQDAVEAPSLTKLRADLYCHHSETRRSLCDALAPGDS